MSRKQHQQSIPHYGVKNGFSRPEGKGFSGATCYHDDPKKMRSFKSIAQAKRFMRTGDPGNGPCTYRASHASKYVTRRASAAQKMSQIRAKS